MKNKISTAILIITVFVIILSGSCKKENNKGSTPIPEPDWVIQDIDSTLLSFNKILFKDTLKGWILGDEGTYVTTTDGGENWEASLLSDVNLYDMFYLNTVKAWIVGDNNTILFSSNDCESWTPQSIVANADLKSIFFTDGLNGWAVGTSDENPSVILHTFNGGTGGNGWLPQTPPENEFALNGVFFINQLEGWVVGDHGTLFRTVNGGAEWTTQSSNTTEKLNVICFVNDEIGCIVGDKGKYLFTYDGGENWYVPYPFSPFEINDIYFLDDSHGWAVGLNGTVFYTQNAGGNWYEQNSETISTLNSVFFSNLDFGWAVGETPDSKGLLLKFVGND